VLNRYVSWPYPGLREHRCGEAKQRCSDPEPVGADSIRQRP